MARHRTGKTAEGSLPSFPNKPVVDETRMGGRESMGVIAGRAYEEACEDIVLKTSLMSSADKPQNFIMLAAHKCLEEETFHAGVNAMVGFLENVGSTPHNQIIAAGIRRISKILNEPRNTPSLVMIAKVAILMEACDELMARINAGTADFMTEPGGNHFAYQVGYLEKLKALVGLFDAFADKAISKLR